MPDTTHPDKRKRQMQLARDCRELTSQTALKTVLRTANSTFDTTPGRLLGSDHRVYARTFGIVMPPTPETCPRVSSSEIPAPDEVVASVWISEYRNPLENPATQDHLDSQKMPCQWPFSVSGMGRWYLANAVTSNDGGWLRGLAARARTRLANAGLGGKAFSRPVGSLCR